MPQDPNLAKLEYLWTALDKLESRMEANDRRLERLERLRLPMRQPFGWDSPAHCAAQRYSAYDQPRRSTCWDRPLYGQPSYTDMYSSYAPPRQYNRRPIRRTSPRESPMLDITQGSRNISPHRPHTGYRVHLYVGSLWHMFHQSLSATRHLTIRNPGASRVLLSVTIHLAPRYLLSL